jgi:hypothetical protein
LTSPSVSATLFDMETILPNREQMLQALKQGVCRITFTKVDGTPRTMFGTLKAEHLPPPKDTDGQEVTKSKPKKSDSYIPVWDMDKKDWRGFRVDSVKEWEEVSNYPSIAI